MAGELWTFYLTNKIVYAAVFRDSDGLVYYIVGDVFEVWGTSGRDADDYDITMAETTVNASMHYFGNFPTAITDADKFRIGYFERLTGTPVDSDIAIAQGELHWDGEREITLSEISISGSTVNNFYDETGDGGTRDAGPLLVFTR